MQKKLKLSIVLLLAVSVIFTTYAFSTHPFLADLSVNYDSTKNPINIIYTYGVAGKNELNTFNGTFTKDLIRDGITTGKLYLTPEDLLQIQQRLDEIDFYNYPESFPSEGPMAPRSDYYLKVVDANITKEVVWYSDSDYHDTRIENLTQLRYFIETIIENKPAYQLFPPANGAYL